MMRKRVLMVAVSVSRRSARRVVPALAVLVLFSNPAPLSGQSWVENFVITAGLTGEAWWGDFSAITVPQFDSTESAVAGVGEWGVRGGFTLLDGPRHRLEATFDGGIRQSATTGFRLRNYAPREQSGTLSMSYARDVGGGVFTAEATGRSRRIVDRPPMPLYKSPGYDIYSVQARYWKRVRAISVDMKVAGEKADYKPPPFLTHLDFLDRNSVTFEAGGRRRFDFAADSEEEEYWAIRLFAAYGYHTYPRQGEGVQRVDHAPRLGTTFELKTARLLLDVTMSGSRNYSTSRRPEYRHGRLNVQAVWFLGDTDLSLVGTLARKRYIDPGQDALVPGEEADNASILYAEVTRALGLRVDGAFRLGWRKVETHFSGAFYTRFGGGFSLRVRPWG